MLGILPRLKRRIKQGVQRFSAVPAGPVAFQGALAREWPELREQYAVSYQTLVSSVVASWEVAAAELNAAARPNFGTKAAEMVTRLSDALVPTLEPLQAAERATKEIWKEATAAGQASGQFSDALKPVASQTRALGAAVEAAWPKTVEYLAPVLEQLKVDGAEVDRLKGVGKTLRDALDARAQSFGEQLSAAGQAENAEGAFLDAVETFRHATAQDLEVALDQVRSVLVGAARAG